MLLVASLNMMAKKALPNKTRQVSIAGLIPALNVAPTTSNDAEIVLLGPMDFRGAAGAKLPQAIESAHPDICIIYLCTNDKEKALCPSRAHIKQCRAIKADVIKDAVSEFYGKDLQAVQQSHSSVSDKVLAADKNPTPHRAVPKPEPAPAPEPEPEPEAVEPAPVPEPEEPPAMPAPPVMPEAQPIPPHPVDVVQSARSIEDFQMFQQQLQRDAVMADALARSSELQGIKQMLSVFSVKMQDVMADRNMTPEQKLDAIRQFGNNRSALAAAQNAKVVDEFLDIWRAVVSTADRIVRERLDEINTAVVKTKTQKADFIEHIVAQTGEEENMVASMTIELINIWGQMTNLYRFAYGQVSEISGHLNDGLPSDNEFINASLGKAREDFNTENAENLVSKLFTGLQEGRISMTQVQDQCSALISTLMEMAMHNQELVNTQKEIMAMLRANNVESIVIRDTLLKDCFRVFVGNKNTGLTATTVMYAGMMSRRGNTLVIDLSKHGRYDRYGFKPYSLDQFMEERIQHPLTFVTTDQDLDPEQITKLLDECKGRMDYYACLVVVLDTEQTEQLDQIGREALTINYVTDCSADSMESITTCYEKARTIPNVGTLLCTIDAPTDAATVLMKMGFDSSRTRLVLIPYLREIKKAAIVQEDPSAYDDTRYIFEQAFRV